ncbi:hypothetical protein RclHR1_00810006 [Rhizophagus clarus]|uniref:Uncharacterized protein n=1 Tax=Rhizophagus clarus TaxID=94130 RepID=A0A2Z6RZW1_9GLOM|nr:hypothetical protein RclHR1_00810006 [Rhizophagus clarus]
MLVSCMYYKIGKILKTVLGHHKGHEIVSFRKEVYQYLRSFTEKLKNTTEPTTFINQIIVETEVFLMNNLNQEKDSKKTSIINGALNFVYYIRDYWCGDLAIGWCIYGRIIAADLLQVSLDQIPKTNNQLESFNSELKVHQLQKYQNNGHLLRFNVLSVDLIKSITPNILLVVFAVCFLDFFLKERYESYASSLKNLT